MESITSFQNPKVKLVKKLRDKHEREKSGLFVIDYPRDLERALSLGYEIEFVLFCPQLSSDNTLVKRITGSPIYGVSPDIIAKASYRENPSEIVAVMKQKPRRGDAQLQGLDATTILGLVGLQKPGNIGALLRSADAAGIESIFLIDTSLDLYNPNIIRSSTGACFLNNIYTLTSEQALQFFRAEGYTVISAALGGTKPLFEIDFKQKSVILLGTEDKGLNDFWLLNSDLKVEIPMVGRITDSLNVSVSGAIFMYEALRQNRK